MAPMNEGRRVLLGTVSERDWRQQVLHWAAARGWLAYFSWTSIHSPSGFPDLVLARSPRLLTVELKTEKGKQTLRQRMWDDTLSSITEYEHHGIWRPADEERVRAVLR